MYADDGDRKDEDESPSPTPGPRTGPLAGFKFPEVELGGVRAIRAAHSSHLVTPVLRTQPGGLLVIEPVPGDYMDNPGVRMQFRVSSFTNDKDPLLRVSEEWQDAFLQEGDDGPQWSFTLPQGRMSVQVRAYLTEGSEASAPSVPEEFDVRE